MLKLQQLKAVAKPSLRLERLNVVLMRRVSPHVIRPLFVSRKKRTLKEMGCAISRYSLHRKYLQLNNLVQVHCWKRKAGIVRSGLDLSRFASLYRKLQACFGVRPCQNPSLVSLPAKPMHGLVQPSLQIRQCRIMPSRVMAGFRSVKQHSEGVDMFTSLPSLLLSAAGELCAFSSRYLLSVRKACAKCW
jgi:hypothetical protein